MHFSRRFSYLSALIVAALTGTAIKTFGATSAAAVAPTSYLVAAARVGNPVGLSWRPARPRDDI